MRWFRGFRHTHAHFCSCGAELRCTQPIDRCGVSRAWECAACEQQQIDAYISRLELDAFAEKVTDLPPPELHFEDKHIRIWRYANGYIYTELLNKQEP